MDRISSILNLNSSINITNVSVWARKNTVYRNALDGGFLPDLVFHLC